MNESRKEREKMARKKTPEELKQYKIQKKLESLDYTPQSAYTLSIFLRGLSTDPPQLRKVRLAAFEKLSEPEKASWR